MLNVEYQRDEMRKMKSIPLIKKCECLYYKRKARHV